MNEIAKLILSLSLSGSILALLLFAIKPIIKHRLSKSIQYYIWIVVLLRLIIPFSFEGSIIDQLMYSYQTTEVNNSQGNVQQDDSSSGNILGSLTLPNVQGNVANGVYNNDIDHNRYFTDLVIESIFYIWLFGVIFALTVNLIGYARFSKQLKQRNITTSDDDNKLLATLTKGRTKVTLVRNRFITTPILIGIIRPQIVIPDYKYNEQQLTNILLHELTHLRRFDLFMKWLTMIVTSIHWFNPLMYIIKKEINRACELSCDEAVIKNLNTEQKQDYGDTLIAVVAEQKYALGALQVTMCEEKKHLKERLLAIMAYNKKSKLLTFISLLLLLVVTCSAVILGASAGKVKDHEIAESKQLDQYKLDTPEHWSIVKLPFASLSFEENGKVIGELGVTPYYPDQPLSQLRNNHTEVIESHALNGFFTEVIQEKIQQTPPAASGDTTVTETLHFYFIMKDKNKAYDLYFYTQDVDEQTAVSVAKSFTLHSSNDAQ
ncbi:M56 family metallopeptidase [Paenibacillus endoradicis]|uniref:M56 family metallopeptidase n=1 Tax=Paenibacillus endoradicis TaxID=2972487 RepID=UPI002159A98D|nr:M56 family metallopeptidase [Paenibacillus endoradicis]MCR8657482.1 M56 family metallopeptidase [Paenibacillus endoradicis]